MKAVKNSDASLPYVLCTGLGGKNYSQIVIFDMFV